MVRLPPSRRVDREEATSMPRKSESKWTVTVSPGAMGAVPAFPWAMSRIEKAPDGSAVYASAAAVDPRRGLSSFLKLERVNGDGV